MKTGDLSALIFITIYVFVMVVMVYLTNRKQKVEHKIINNNIAQTNFMSEEDYKKELRGWLPRTMSLKNREDFFNVKPHHRETVIFLLQRGYQNYGGLDGMLSQINEFERRTPFQFRHILVSSTDVLLLLSYVDNIDYFSCDKKVFDK